MSLDVLLREVHEKFEGFCSTKGETQGVCGRGAHGIGLIMSRPIRSMGM